MSFIPLRRLRAVSISWWICTLLIAITIGFLVSQTVEKAQQTSARFGEMKNVLVANRQINPGEKVAPEDVHEAQWPVALLPAGGTLNQPDDTTIATTTILANEPVANSKIDGSGVSPAAALLRQNERGVAIPRSTTSPQVKPGDFVDLVSANAKVASPENATATAVISSARVIDSTDKAITIAVSDKQLIAAATTAATGNAVLALTKRSGD